MHLLKTDPENSWFPNLKIIVENLLGIQPSLPFEYMNGTIYRYGLPNTVEGVDFFRFAHKKHTKKVQCVVSGLNESLTKAKHSLTCLRFSVRPNMKICSSSNGVIQPQQVY